MPPCTAVRYFLKVPFSHQNLVVTPKLRLEEPASGVAVVVNAGGGIEARDVNAQAVVHGAIAVQRVAIALRRAGGDGNAQNEGERPKPARTHSMYLLERVTLRAAFLAAAGGTAAIAGTG